MINCYIIFDKENKIRWGIADNLKGAIKIIEYLLGNIIDGKFFTIAWKDGENVVEENIKHFYMRYGGSNMEIISTTEHFNLSIEQAQEIRNDCGYTREECMVLDSGLESHFYDTEEEMKKGYEYYKKCRKGWEIKIYQFSDGRYCIMLS